MSNAASPLTPPAGPNLEVPAKASIFDQKTVVALVALATMIALAAMHQIEGAVVADFVKWLAMTYVGGAAIQGAAARIALGQAASAAPPSPAAHADIVRTLKRD